MPWFSRINSQQMDGKSFATSHATLGIFARSEIRESICQYSWTLHRALNSINSLLQNCRCHWHDSRWSIVKLYRNKSIASHEISPMKSPLSPRLFWSRSGIDSARGAKNFSTTQKGQFGVRRGLPHGPKKRWWIAPSDHKMLVSWDHLPSFFLGMEYTYWNQQIYINMATRQHVSSATTESTESQFKSDHPRAMRRAS